MKRFVLLLLLATPQFVVAKEPEIGLMQFLPAIPKRVRAGECWPARDLGICLECHCVHDFGRNDRTPLSDRGVKELSTICETLFR